MNECDIFVAALERDSLAERKAYLDEACAGNADLRQRIESLFESHDLVGNLLERPALGAAATVRPFQSDISTEASAIACIGCRIGPYKLLQQIGEGGFGVVYMAEQQVPVRRKVALKIIKPGMDTKEVIARFESERQALALMDHPNIAKVLDAGATAPAEGGYPGRPYFVMELIRGIPITQFCDENHLTPDERLELFIQVCNALQHAHQKGIIHRDLKPTNVLVTLRDGCPVPKVIDFGVAKATSQTLTERTLFTAYGQMIGTPAYMSPEQAEMSCLDIDTRSDIYSLGVLLYELLTGTTPFDARRLREAGFAEMQRIICEEEPENVSTRIARIAKTQSAEFETRNSGFSAPRSNELDWIVGKFLEKDREQRYESASSFARDIRRYLADEPVLACPPSALYRLRKFARRHRRSLVMAATVAAALMGSVVALAVAYSQVSQKQQQTQAALDRERQTLYYNRIGFADSNYWLANDVGQAERLLDECPVAFRRWEWHYLKRLCHTELQTLRNSSPALSVAYSPDGQRLAAAHGNEVTLWDMPTGRERLRLRGHTTVVSSVVFGPEGKLLATCSDDQTIRVWDAESGREIHSIRGHAGRVRCVAFSPLGNFVVSGGQDNTIKAWDIATGKELFSLQGHGGPIRALAFSRDGQRLASASDDHTVGIWDLTTREQIHSLRGHTNYVLCVAFDPEGRYVASGGYGWMGKIWDLATGQEVQTLRGHKHYVSGIAFIGNGDQLATASYDQTIKLWDPTTGRELRTLRGHSNWVHQIAFGGGRLASAGHDQTVKIWDPAVSQEARVLAMPSGEAHDVAFSPDGKRLATAGGDHDVRIWDAATGQQLLVLSGHTWRVWDVAFSPDGKLLASAGGRRGDPDPADVKVWDATTGSELFTLLGHTRTVRKVAFSPDGRRLASASHDHTVKVWDVTNGRELYAIPAHTKEVVGVAFSPSGQQLATSSMDATVKLWDAASGRLVRTYASHNYAVYEVAFSPDGRRLASVGSGSPSCLRVWNVETGEEIRSTPVRTTALNGLAYSPDGRRIATVSYDGSAKIWDAETGQDILTLRGHSEQAWGVAFSTGGWRLATASYDGTVRIWDATPIHIDDQRPRAGDQQMTTHH